MSAAYKSATANHYLHMQARAAQTRPQSIKNVAKFQRAEARYAAGKRKRIPFLRLLSPFSL